jgi:hypothetical protein
LGIETSFSLKKGGRTKDRIETVKQPRRETMRPKQGRRTVTQVQPSKMRARLAYLRRALGRLGLSRSSSPCPWPCPWPCSFSCPCPCPPTPAPVPAVAEDEEEDSEGDDDDEDVADDEGEEAELG